MSIVDISKQTSVDTTLDGVVIQMMIEDVPGGRSLDVTDIETDVIKAGHVILRNDTTKEFKAHKITGGSYAAKPGGYSYYGILYVSIPKDAPLASIMVRGTVNEKAAQEAAGLPEYISAVKNALTLIRFVEA